MVSAARRRSTNLHAEVAQALEQLARGEAGADARIERWARQSRGNLRQALIAALAACWSARWDTITLLLTAWTERDDPVLQRVAALGWGMVGRDTPETALVMLERLARARPYDRGLARAIDAALPMVWPNHTRYMLRVLAHWQVPDAPLTLRLRAATALGHFPEAPAPALAALETSERDAHPAVRRRAAAARARLTAR